MGRITHFLAYTVRDVQTNTQIDLFLSKKHPDVELQTIVTTRDVLAHSESSKIIFGRALPQNPLGELTMLPQTRQSAQKGEPPFPTPTSLSS